jgi:hypothetical protein
LSTIHRTKSSAKRFPTHVLFVSLPQLSPLAHFPTAFFLSSRTIKMAARKTSTVAPGAPQKLQPRKGKDGFVADNVFAISSVVPEDVRSGVEAFEAMDSKPFRRCLQIASRIASGDAIDERLLSETGELFPSFFVVTFSPLLYPIGAPVLRTTCPLVAPAAHVRARRIRRIVTNCHHGPCLYVLGNLPQVTETTHFVCFNDVKCRPSATLLSRTSNTISLFSSAQRFETPGFLPRSRTQHPRRSYRQSPVFCRHVAETSLL